MKHNLKANCYAIRVQSQLEMEGKKFKALSGISKPGSTVTQNWGPAAYHSETNKVLYQLTIKKKKKKETQLVFHNYWLHLSSLSQPLQI